MYFPATATSKWVDEQLVKYADPFDQLEVKTLIVSFGDITGGGGNGRVVKASGL